MAPMDSIPIEVDSSSALTGNVLPLLHEMRHALEDFATTGTEHTIDLNSLPLAPQESRELEELLGTGEVCAQLDALGDQNVMLKLTLPEQDNFYRDCIEHKNVLKVVALSGGYSRAEANERLERQNGMVASFSRALSEGLSAQQSDDDFNATIAAAIDGI